MQRLHLHTAGWTHMHKPDWHLFAARLDHMIHDPRFWAVLVLVALFAAMIALAFVSRSGIITNAPFAPIYPYGPYIP